MERNRKKKTEKKGSEKIETAFIFDCYKDFVFPLTSSIPFDPLPPLSPPLLLLPSTFTSSISFQDLSLSFNVHFLTFWTFSLLFFFLPFSLKFMKAVFGIGSGRRKWRRKNKGKFFLRHCIYSVVTFNLFKCIKREERRLREIKSIFEPFFFLFLFW